MSTSLGGQYHVAIIVQIMMPEVGGADNDVRGFLISGDTVDYPHSFPKIQEAIVR